MTLSEVFTNFIENNAVIKRNRFQYQIVEINDGQNKKIVLITAFLNDNRIVFNIKGNNYRLIVRINYNYQMIWIRFIGTHAEYDKINANEI
jgi:mRNA-degrading endonuclease HigB of HigAB toxin-antitoxin module